ncbi:CidA/LrgA family protein [Brevirhabdus sp.]|uniref:CidA/LrgA family protein n=1 Tax=Brevirhabdus sp. TaxID=2004514 RepID=UPI0040582EA6
MILHLAVILGFQLLGELAVRGLGLAIPGPVVGMALLLTLFLLIPRAAEAIRPTAQGLLAHLSLLFVPAGVGVVGHLDTLGSAGLPVLIAIVFSTVLTIAVAALVFVGVARLAGGAADE